MIFKKPSLFKVLFWLSALGLGGGLLPSCIKKKPDPYVQFPPETTLRFNLEQEPPTLDWNKTADTTSNLIADNIMEGLSGYDFSNNSLKPVPVLAEKWTSSPDHKTWTFTIKKNIQWNDGVPLSVHHFLDSWERLLNPQTASEYAYYLFPIKNARAYNDGSLKDFSKVGVKVNVRGELVVTLHRGKAYFPSLLAYSATFPIRKDLIQKHGPAQWNTPKNLVTLGAYRLKKWVHDEQIILEKNPLYHGKPAHIPHIVLYMIPNTTTALNLFEQGRMDVIKGLPSKELPVLRQKKTYHEQAILSTYYYGFHTKKKPFDNPLVRKAFALSINKKEITSLLGGGRTPLGGWIPKGMFGYDPRLGLAFNPQKGRQLLKQAGFSESRPFPNVVLSFNTDDDHKRIAENIQAQLKKNLHIEVELSNQEWKSYLNSLKSGQQQLYRIGWVADYPDPDNFMTLMTSVSDSNRTFWHSPYYDQLVGQASSLPSNAKRFALYRKAQKFLTEQEVPVIPIYSNTEHFLISERVKHFPLNVMSQTLFRKVEFY